MILYRFNEDPSNYYYYDEDTYKKKASKVKHFLNRIFK